jgi:hypothetical protein
VLERHAVGDAMQAGRELNWRMLAALRANMRNVAWKASSVSWAFFMVSTWPLGRVR